MLSLMSIIFCCFPASGASTPVPESCSVGPQVRESAVSTAQLEHQNELRAPSAYHAAYYLDAAIAARTVPGRRRTFFYSLSRF